MRVYLSALVAISVAALALGGCSGTSFSGASSVPGTVPVVPGHASTGKSWMRPNAGGQKLLYIADSGSGTVQVYAYPSLVLDGELTGFIEPLFDCADRDGNVWIVDYGAGQMTEYAHGGTSPIATLTGLTLPYECSVDRPTGDLAVAENIESDSVHLGEVAVFHPPYGTPNVYSDPNFGLIDGVTYDRSGNLYVDGYRPGDAFGYAKLPAGSSTFTEITLSRTPANPGKVFWDGRFVDVADYGNTIYQVKGANVVNMIQFNLSNSTLRGFFVPSWGQHVIATDAYANQVSVFPYPAGGTATKGIASGLNTPWDVVLSVTPANP